jgi:hypothetical protein
MLDLITLKILVLQNGANIFIHDAEDRLADLAIEHSTFGGFLFLLGTAGIIATTISSTHFGVEHSLDNSPVKEVLINGGVLAALLALGFGKMALNGMDRVEVSEN